MAWVYILKCSDGSYYTGSTKNLEKRLTEHNTKVFDGYTAKRLPIKLVYCCEMPSVHDAFLKERQIKSWSRRKKEALINREWEKLVEYSKSSSSAIHKIKHETSKGGILRQAQDATGEAQDSYGELVEPCSLPRG